MTNTLPKVRWMKILLASVSATVTYVVLVVLASTIPTVVLAFSGEPDQGGIVRTLESLRPWATLILTVLTVLPTVVAAAWAARRTTSGTATVHGLLVGLLVAVSPVFGLLGPPSLVLATVTVAAGVLGGWLGGQGRTAGSLKG